MDNNKKYLKSVIMLKLKTSSKINLMFTIFNIISIVIVLISINIAYFGVWIKEAKIWCHSGMIQNFEKIQNLKDEYSMADFKKTVMNTESYIIYDDWTKEVSKLISYIWIDEDKLKDNSVIFKKNDRVYFVFEEKFENFWDVKTLFDITEFIKLQTMVLKASLIVILLSIIIYFIAWKIFTKIILKDLNKIVKFTKNLDLNKRDQSLFIAWREDDEIKIVADSINKSIAKISKQSENLKGFICNIAHELKTPLMIINSDIDLHNAIVNKKWHSEELEKETLKKVKCKVRMLNETIETLFYVSRLEEWVMIFKKEKIAISNYINILCDELSKVYSDKNIEIEFNIKDWILLHIDETSFKIIAKNLIQNAFKYNKNWGKIKIDLCEEWFFVTDSGVWIKKENLEKIFNNFFRWQENWDWIGLWLYLVKKLTELYGYKINVKSEEWIWTEFKILFK